MSCGPRKTQALAAAIEADIDVMYLTVDTSVTSVREKDVRNGFRAVT